MNKLPEIPVTWTIFILIIGLIIMRTFGIDTWTTAAISTLIGYLTGKHVEQTKTPMASVIQADVLPLKLEISK